MHAMAVCVLRFPGLHDTRHTFKSDVIHVLCCRSADGRPSPNYRIYSNAFQGGRVTGNGVPLNYSHTKVTTPYSAALISCEIPLHTLPSCVTGTRGKVPAYMHVGKSLPCEHASERPQEKCNMFTVLKSLRQS